MCQDEKVGFWLLPRGFPQAIVQDLTQKGYVRFEIDTFVRKKALEKEDVGRTYQGVDGYCPIDGYLGNEGWNIGLELRAGTHHSALESEYFHEWTFARAGRTAPGGQSVLTLEGVDSMIWSRQPSSEPLPQTCH